MGVENWKVGDMIAAAERAETLERERDEAVARAESAAVEIERLEAENYGLHELLEWMSNIANTYARMVNPPAPTKAVRKAASTKVKVKAAPVSGGALAGLYGALSDAWRGSTELARIARANGFTGSPTTIYNRALRAAKAGLIDQDGEPGSYRWKLT